MGAVGELEEARKTEILCKDEFEPRSNLPLSPGPSPARGEGSAGPFATVFLRSRGRGGGVGNDNSIHAIALRKD